MHVLSVAKSTGGVAAYNRSLCERLSARGYSVRVVCLSEGGESYAASLEASGIPAVAMEMERYAIAPISDLRLTMKLLRDVRRQRPDLIVAHGAKAGLLTRLVGRIAGVPVVYTLHSQPFLKRVQGRRAFIYRQLERIGSMLGGHLVAITESMREELRRNRIAPTSNITVIHTGIDVTPFDQLRPSAAARLALGLDPYRPVVGWMGRLSAQKGPLDYVRAAARLLETVPEAQIFMAGEGPLAGEVHALAEELGIGERLVAAGWQEDVPGVLAALDVYVMTSYWEGLPLSLLEAMAAGRAVVSTAVDGAREVVEHGVHGYLVDPGDYSAVAEHAGGLLLDSELRGRLGSAAHRRATTRFTVVRMIEEWENVLKRQTAGATSAA